MVKKKTLILALILFSSLIASGGEADPIPGANWHPPKEGIVRNQKTAITIARAIWLSMNPDMEDRIGSEEDWQSGMVATLHNGVWRVGDKTKGAEPGNGLYIFISKQDAHVVDIFVIQ